MVYLLEFTRGIHEEILALVYAKNEHEAEYMLREDRHLSSSETVKVIDYFDDILGLDLDINK